MHFFGKAPAALLLLAAQTSRAIPLDLGNQESIKNAAATLAYNMASYYNGNQSGQTPGTLPQPYYWWECGAMFGTLIDYWYYTGDTSYNDMVIQGMVFQNGGGDYMPPNQTLDLGNDDQMFWGFAAMSAAELNFPNPSPSDPQWLGLAQGVFNIQATRWDTTECGGGMQWQIFPTNPGWNYKNTPANGGFFNLATRLGAYTNNETYFVWANRTWDWMEEIGLISPQGSIYDGTTPEPNNCTTINHNEWSYNAGMMLNGAAVMWNVTNSTLWYNRAMSIWNASSVFFQEPGMIMRELCEINNNCNTNEYSFKAYLSRFTAASTKVAPWLTPLVSPYLAASAQAAAEQCTGGANQTTCGSKWTNNGTYDGNPGLGQEMSALEVVQSQLIHQSKAPVSSKTGGTSKGDPSAGSGAVITSSIPLSNITTGDRAGAGILTALVLASALSGTYFMVA